MLDSGWHADQVVSLTSASLIVGGSGGFSDTFTPQPASALAPTCDLPTNAQVKVSKVDGSTTGDVNEPVSVQPSDTDGVFHVVDCKLMYNLATSSLSGAGTYKVWALIDGTQASNPAVFDLK
jgi:hypothetical protein